MLLPIIIALIIFISILFLIIPRPYLNKDTLAEKKALIEKYKNSSDETSQYQLYHEIKRLENSSIFKTKIGILPFVLIPIAILAALLFWYMSIGHRDMAMQRLEQHWQSETQDELSQSKKIDFASISDISGVPVRAEMKTFFFCQNLNQKIDHNNINQLKKLAICYANATDFQTAIRIFERMNRLQPNDAHIIIPMAILMILQDPKAPLPEAIAKQIQDYQDEGLQHPELDRLIQFIQSTQSK